MRAFSICYFFMFKKICIIKKNEHILWSKRCKIYHANWLCRKMRVKNMETNIDITGKTPCEICVVSTSKSSCMVCLDECVPLLSFKECDHCMCEECSSVHL